MVKFAQLDAEKLKTAETYIPLARKIAIIKVLAPGCVEEVSLTLNGQPLPPRWQENTLGRRLVMSYVLAGLYLHMIDASGLYKEKPEFNFSARQYDTFSKLYHQIESFKRNDDPEVKVAAHSVMADYREFDKLLGAEIYNLLQAKNDLCFRVVSMLTMQADPEFVQKSVEALNEAKKAAEEAAKEHQDVMESFKQKGA